MNSLVKAGTATPTCWLGRALRPPGIKALKLKRKRNLPFLAHAGPGRSSGSPAGFAEHNGAGPTRRTAQWYHHRAPASRQQARSLHTEARRSPHRPARSGRIRHALRTKRTAASSTRPAGGISQRTAFHASPLQRERGPSSPRSNGGRLRAHTQRWPRRARPGSKLHTGGSPRRPGARIGMTPHAKICNRPRYVEI